jgi:glycerophosphoryl diester phosphodiesterase
VGNDLAELAVALGVGADVVECDVHLSRRRLEVRHHKSLGRLPWLWDKWELVPRSDGGLLLHDVLANVPPGTTLMLDLKGVGRVGARVARVLDERPEVPVIVCSRWWRGTRPFVDLPWVTRVLSGRGRTELALLRRHLARGSKPGGVCLHLSLLTPALVDELHAWVPLVMTWPVDDAASLERARVVGVDGVISKDLEVLRAVGPGRRG